jgi:hypothetical protein
MDCGLEVEAIGYVPQKRVRKAGAARRRKAGRPRGKK